MVKMPKAIIVGEIGSTAHGLGVATSDHDYHGVYVDPPRSLIALKSMQGAYRKRDKPEGVKSEAGDSETTFYGLRKFTEYVISGNPTMLTLLFTPRLLVPDELGVQTALRACLNRRVAARHIGYADSMAARLRGDKAPRTNRPELIAKHGYDTKAAFHAIRLLIQGHELLTTGTMAMPMREHHRHYLLHVRNGYVPEKDALEAIDNFRADLVFAESRSALPVDPDYDAINRWLVETHMRYWLGNR